VPDTLVKSMTQYARDPTRLYAWRNGIGDLIDRAGLPEVNPWGDNFGPRGLAATRSLDRTSAAVSSGGAAEGGGNRGTAQPVPLLTEQGPDGEFSGWKSYHETPGTRTADVWRLQPDGVLICKGSPRGYLYTERDYQDFTLQFEGVVDGGTVTQKVNGVVVNQATGCEVVPGKILFTAEGQEIHFRNVRLIPR
jgi:hypothetical protein